MRLQDTTAKPTSSAPSTALKSTSPSGPSPGTAKATRAAADQQKVSDGVESMFVRQMLEASHMFEGIGGHPMMQGMMLEKLSDAVVKGGHLGIGDSVTGKHEAISSPNRSVHGPAGNTNAVDHTAINGLGSADELQLLRPAHKKASPFGGMDSMDSMGGMDGMGMGGMGLSVSLNDISLPDDLLPRAAKDAIDEGRVDGLGKGASIDAALHRSWRPAQGAAQGDTGVIPLAQADSNEILGEGPKTVRQVGCLLTSMTMVSNALTGQRNSVDDANRLVTANGGFRGNNMQFGPASSALGLRVTGRSAFNGDASTIDASIDRGHPVVVGVDFKDGSSSGLGRTDHFLVVTGRAPGGGYTAIDSGDGRSLTFRPDDTGTLRAGKYSLSEVITVEPASRPNITRAPSAAAATAAAARWSMLDAFGS